jgi:phosphotransferase system HPr (HPr) family protein
VGAAVRARVNDILPAVRITREAEGTGSRGRADRGRARPGPLAEILLDPDRARALREATEVESARRGAGDGAARREDVPAKSILGVLSLGAVQGTEITLEADGPGAEEALDALTSLLSRDLDTEEALDA